MSLELVRHALNSLASKGVVWAGGAGSRDQHFLDHGEFLPDRSTADDYDQVVLQVASDAETTVLLNHDDAQHEEVRGVALGGLSGGRFWFVSLTLDGEVRTAFPPTRGTEYLKDSRYILIGKRRSVNP